MSTAVQRMMDRFERRKRNFKRQVIDMIDGLFDEMVDEFVTLVDFEPSMEEMENGADGGSGNSSIRAEDDQQQEQQQLMDIVVEQSTAHFPKRIRTVIPETRLIPLAAATSGAAGSSNGQQQTQQQHQQHQRAKRPRENAASVLIEEHRSADSNISDDLMMVPQAELPVKFDEFEENGAFLNHDNNNGMAAQMNFDEMLRPVPHSSSTINITSKFPPTRTSTSSAVVSNRHGTTHPPEPSDDSNSFDSSHFGVSASQDSSRYVSTVRLKCWVQNCNILFEGKAALDTHISTAHNVIEAFCCFSNTCDRTFKYRSLRNNHIRTAHKINNAPLGCRFCGRTFKNMQSLTSHFNEVHEGGTFSCTLCPLGQRFTADNRSEVRKHVRIFHPRFTCLCGRAFTNQATLDAHRIKMHISDRPFRCAFQGCGYSATRKGQVVMHVRRVHFGQLHSVRQQIEMGVEDRRNPYHYVIEDQIRIDEEGGGGGDGSEGEDGEVEEVPLAVASSSSNNNNKLQSAPAAPHLLKVGHSLKGNEQIVYNGYTLERNGSYTSSTRSGVTTLYWRCAQYHNSRCVFRVSTGDFVAAAESGGSGGYPFQSYKGEHTCSASKELSACKVLYNER